MRHSNAAMGESMSDQARGSPIRLPSAGELHKSVHRLSRDMPLQTSVIVPTWRRPAWLERCLRALGQQDPAPEEVIVVGRAQDEAAQRVSSAATATAAFLVRWVPVDKPGHVAPVRRGLAEAVGEIVAFLDDDAEPELGWLAALSEPFADLRVGCVGGRVVTPGFRGKVKRDAGRIRWYGQYVGNVGALDVAGPVEVDGVMEGNWAWRADVLRRLEFDPVLDFDAAPMYGLDLCVQAKALGYKVLYQPTARIVHYAAPRDPALDRMDRPRRAMAYSRNYTYIGLKHLWRARRLAFIAWWWLVGERGSYGLGAAAIDIVRIRHGIAPQIRASLVGKWAGVRAWLAARR